MRNTVLKKRSSKGLLIGCTVALLLIVIVSTYILDRKGVIDLRKSSDTNSSDEIAVKSAGPPPNTVSYEPANEADATTIPEKNPNPTIDLPTNSELKTVITQIRKSTAGDTVLVKAVITGSTEGGCSVTAYRNGTTLTATSGIVLSSGQYGCDSLSIPISSFNSSGSWLFTLTVTDKNGAKTTDSQESSITK